MKKNLHRKVVPLVEIDPDLSSIELELDSLEWSLQQIAERLASIEAGSGLNNDPFIKSARNYLNNALQRSHRARQIRRGIKVYKA